MLLRNIFPLLILTLVFCTIDSHAAAPPLSDGLYRNHQVVAFYSEEQAVFHAVTSLFTDEHQYSPGYVNDIKRKAKKLIAERADELCQTISHENAASYETEPVRKDDTLFVWDFSKDSLPQLIAAATTRVNPIEVFTAVTCKQGPIVKASCPTPARKIHRAKPVPVKQVAVAINQTEKNRPTVIRETVYVQVPVEVPVPVPASIMGPPRILPTYMPHY